MKSGIIWWVVGFVIGLIGAFIPVLGLPLILVGGLIALVGLFKIIWSMIAGTASVAGKGASAAAGVAKSATKRSGSAGSGTL